MYAVFHMCMYAEKTAKTTIKKWGKVIMGLRATLPNHIPACRSEFFAIFQPVPNTIQPQSSSVKLQPGYFQFI